MNIINIQLDLNDEELKVLYDKGINAISSEQLGEALLISLNNFLNTESGARLFYTTRSDGYHFNERVPTDITKKITNEILQKTDTVNQAIEQAALKVAEYLCLHGEDVIKQYIIQAFTDKLFSTEEKYNLRHITERILNGN